MNSLMTLVFIMTPLFLGFAIRLPKAFLPWIDKGLAWLVYVILVLIGVSLSGVKSLGTQIGWVTLSAVLLFVLVLGANVLALMWFDRAHPWQRLKQVKRQLGKAQVSVSGSLQQILCVLIGLVLGKAIPPAVLLLEASGTYALMLLVFLVGLQLRSSGITLRQVLINKRGVQTSVLVVFSALMAGLLFAALIPQVSWSQGLALASGFGWYSLSGIVMTEAYGPLWGSVALLNDLVREFFALAFIPLLMRNHPSAAVGVGGATSLDFTLPIIQSSGGLEVVPLAISFGFIINIIAPILMVMFTTFTF